MSLARKQEHWKGNKIERAEVEIGHQILVRKRNWEEMGHCRACEEEEAEEKNEGTELERERGRGRQRGALALLGKGFVVQK